jgi:light-regulated signal transduction histidine kinase (bacteriophytochrome)
VYRNETVKIMHRKTVSAEAMQPEEPVVTPSEVERLRNELELISYLTSHDLQAPLRIMLMSCEELGAHLPPDSDAEAKAALERLTRQATHMKALLENLLEYTRLETFIVKHTALDSNEILAATLAALEGDIQAVNATITHDTLPPVMGHRGRLTRLFAHLIDNALKFRGSASPKIHISARPTGTQWTFCIEDNGLGIEKEYYDIVFALFQRLHSAETYPGMGAGLALSRKIVESHGGRLWVESEPGKGSRFYFTLPGAT